MYIMLFPICCVTLTQILPILVKPEVQRETLACICSLSFAEENKVRAAVALMMSGIVYG